MLVFGGVPLLKTNEYSLHSTSAPFDEVDVFSKPRAEPRRNGGGIWTPELVRRRVNGKPPARCIGSRRPMLQGLGPRGGSLSSHGPMY